MLLADKTLTIVAGPCTVLTSVIWLCNRQFRSSARTWFQQWKIQDAREDAAEMALCTLMELENQDLAASIDFAWW